VANSLHIKSILDEAKIASRVNVDVHTDPSAGKSIAASHGTSKKTRHIQLKYLYVQDFIASGIVKLHKIHGERNLSDVFA
jgi:hypothetical protein